MKLTYRYILTISGSCIKVSHCDYDRLIQYSWTAKKNHKGREYRSVSAIIGKKCVKLHRFILSLTDPNEWADHINGDTLDNRRENLRVVNAKENAANRKLATTNKTGKTGVYFHSRQERYIACIRVNGKLVHLGSFLSLNDAISARKSAELKYRGETERS